MYQHVLGTSDRLLAEANPYDAVWGIVYRADHQVLSAPPHGAASTC